MMKDRIVAEVSTTWSGGFNLTDKKKTSEKFEAVIETNKERGYELESWQFQQSAVCNPGEKAQLIETVIAVFKKKDAT